MNYKTDFEEYLDWITEDIKSNWDDMSEEQQQTILDILNKTDYTTFVLAKCTERLLRDESL